MPSGPGGQGEGASPPLRLSLVEQRSVRGVRDKLTAVGVIVVDAFFGERWPADCSGAEHALEVTAPSA